ncbi:MAG: DEAD/DEAH box helicase [Phytoplasma sp.]|uniref:DEAD/DEAH box helicase n=1 Tax=Phytoplasma sp. TaxID=2155 RepID=UPI002B407922|nr:DEAD/DEAH box helicase [Phytoplasma sp.]WRH06543.1 MAG: DEAD/DEAH box helicase [Phytoplasma sp.]
MENYIKQKLKQLKFEQITPIQKEVFANFKQPYHLVGSAPTGTGKTHAYLLPVLSQIDWNLNVIQAVIVVPTNELVFQVFKMLKELEQRNSQVKIFYGGMDKQKISKSLEKNQPPLIITTLNKLNEYTVVLKKLNIYKSSFLILDEADALFDQNSLYTLDVLLSKWKPKILLFSASITNNMNTFIQKYFGKSLFLDVHSQQKLNIKYYLLQSSLQKRLNDLKHFMKNLNPFSALIFFSKKTEQLKIYNELKSNNFNVLNFSSDLLVKKRKYLMTEIKKMKYQYILASDLAARGLDLDIQWVIHYDLPSKNLEFFQHRSGRTGRMGKEGNVILFYDEKEELSLIKIKKNYGICFNKIMLTENGFREIKTDIDKNKNNSLSDLKKKKNIYSSKKRNLSIQHKYKKHIPLKRNKK